MIEFDDLDPIRKILFVVSDLANDVKISLDNIQEEFEEQTDPDDDELQVNILLLGKAVVELASSLDPKITKHNFVGDNIADLCYRCGDRYANH